MSVNVLGRPTAAWTPFTKTQDERNYVLDVVYNIDPPIGCRKL